MLELLDGMPACGTLSHFSERDIQEKEKYSNILLIIVYTFFLILEALPLAEVLKCDRKNQISKCEDLQSFLSKSLRKISPHSLLILPRKP